MDCLSSVISTPSFFLDWGLSQASFLLLTQAKAELGIWPGCRVFPCAQTHTHVVISSHTVGLWEVMWYGASFPNSHPCPSLSHETWVMGQRGQYFQGVPV